MYAIREGIIVVNQEGKIQSFNLYAEDLFGYSAEEVIDKSLDLLIYSESNSNVCYITKCLETREKKCDAQIFKAIKKDGTKFSIRLSITEIHINGDTLFTGIITPIADGDEVYHTKMIENLQEMQSLTQQLRQGKL